MRKPYGIYCVRHNGCDSGTPAALDDLDAAIREPVAALTRAEDENIPLRLPFLDAREWRGRSQVLRTLTFARDAESLYQLAKEKDPKLNRVTVYRTLKLLKAGGLVDELDLMHFEGDQHYYETRLKQEHAHVVCLRCGKVDEFFGEPIQRIRRHVESSLGFQIVSARTEIGGYCPDCQSQRAQESAEAAGEKAESPSNRAAPRLSHG